MKVWYKIGQIIVWGCIAAYLVIALSFTEDQIKNLKVKELRVLITDSTDVQFINGEDVVNKLKSEGIAITGVSVDSINKDYIRSTVNKIEEVRESVVFISPEGYLYIKIVQRQPVFRIISGEKSYYLDEEREILKFSDRFSPVVPVVTGATSEVFVKNELFEMVKFIKEEPFWFAFVAEVRVIQDHSIELVPSLGNQRILFGQPENFEWKFVKLKALYSHGLPNLGWDTYSSIDLRFGDQVICQKNKESNHGS